MEITASSSRQGLLHHAVAHRSRTSSLSEKFLDRAFIRWFDGLVYNQIWEDPEVDLQALSLSPADHVVTITSAGCNVLNYLTACPLKITAVDLNPHHLALARLKAAAVRELPAASDLVNFLGHGTSPHNLLNYRLFIAPTLDKETRRYWENSKSIEGSRIGAFQEGFYLRSRSALFLGFVHRLMRTIGCDPTKVLGAGSLEEQQARYRQYIEPAFRHPAVRLLGQLPVTLFSLGIPPHQFKIMREEAQGQILKIFEERVRRLACDYPIRSNYFAWQAFSRSYNVEDLGALPRYLQPQHFELLKERVRAVDFRYANVIELLEQAEPCSVNAVVLLDAQDWMAPTVVRRLWKAILRAGAPGARVIFRSAGRESLVPAAFDAEILSRVRTDPEKNTEWHARDRSSIYGSFYCCQLV
jgi:S-adenosylmethionine-diacylglycerol 3-amino-3-carboxypropyl transferase